jgi:transposase
MWSTSLATPSMTAGTGSSRTPAATGDARATRSTPRGGPSRTGVDLVTEQQTQRLDALFDGDTHVEVEATWGVYQRMTTAYREPDRARGRQMMSQVIDSLASRVPAALTEVHKLSRSLARRADDVLAYFDRPGTSNGPTEAMNGRLEHLRGSALDFRSLTNYIARALLETGGFRPRLHRGLR